MTAIYFPGSDKLIKILEDTYESTSMRFAFLFDTTLNLFEMSLQIFIITTIGYYKDTILNEPPQYRKKIRQLKEIIRKGFRAPTLGTLERLTKTCIYLVEEDPIGGPEQLISMKQCLITPVPLGPIAKFFNDLENIFHKLNKNSTKPKTIYQEQSSQKLIYSIFPIIREHRNTAKHLVDIPKIIDDYGDELDLRIDDWKKALEKLLWELNPILSNPFVHKTLEGVYTSPDGFIEEAKDNLCFSMKITKYHNNKQISSEGSITFAEYEATEEYQRTNISELLLFHQNTQIAIDLFPFLMIEDNDLYLYKRTIPRGYEYYSPLQNKTAIIHTKRKFSHSLFGIGIKGDKQAIFWTEVLPEISPVSNIKANIPTDGRLEHFVGRKKQIRRIIEEILEIPMQNGIMYGPGGVGKTALMLALSKEVLRGQKRDTLHFDNIIWISSKPNYYNPLLDLIEPKERQAESLDNIFAVILRFFEHEDVDDYNFSDKEQLVFELLEENRILLILDNFETFSKKDAGKIINFFGLDVKRRLKEKPYYFKIIITSRELIPSGFHQIKLKGLDLRESKQLMNSLFKPYKSAREKLSEEQKEQIHEITHGIPITIKHCFGQIYEYNRTLGDVIQSLSVPTSKLIQFSYSEILRLLRNDPIQLKIVILLELITFPLLIRQISDILEIGEQNISERLPNLINFQIVERIYQGTDEKYVLNEEVSLLTKALIQENDPLAQAIRTKMAENFSLDKQMDYTSEELSLLGVFNQYLANQNYVDAEKFIKDQLEKKRDSILFRFHYARYLKEQKGDIQGAIGILQKLTEAGEMHPNIVRLLVGCFTCMDNPRYGDASIYVKKLEDSIHIDDDIKFEVADFYIGWSRSLKIGQKKLDPVEEIKRRSRYKELANKAIQISGLIKLENRTHRYYYLLAQSYFNLWKYNDALKMIDRAIDLIKNDPNYAPSYLWLRRRIQKKMTFFSPGYTI